MTLRLRAELAFPEYAREAPSDCDAKPTVEPCASKLEPGDEPTRYMKWRRCLEEFRPLGSMLPLARFKTPDTGWIILRGRRGHYRFCDELRAYDLSTGSAYVAQSCSALALRPLGTVDGAATDDARKVKVTRGQVPKDAVREAAWMTFFAKDVRNDVQIDSWSVESPDGLTRQWSEGAIQKVHTYLREGGWVHSGQTEVAWSWQDGPRLRGSGSITWPNSSNAGETHAVRLWEIAEESLDEGCPRARFPAQVIVDKQPGISPVDATDQDWSEVERTLLTALTKNAEICP
jgi:hypothetical protein